MNNLIEIKIAQLKEWFQGLERREKIFVFLLSFALIYVVFDRLIMAPLVHREMQLALDLKKMEGSKSILMQKVSVIESVSVLPSFQELNNQAKKLTQIIAKNTQTIQGLIPVYVHPNDIPKVSHAILSQQAKNVSLINLYSAPHTLWGPRGIKKENGPINDLTQHTITLRIRGDYFGSMAYLYSLENLSWHLYWESLEYDVSQYPMATITMNLYVFSKRGIDES